MYVTELKISNIRGFHGKRDSELALARPDGTFAGWTVLAGRNGSGKTSLLRALALALCGPAVARSLVPDFSRWLSHGASEGWVQARLRRDVESDGLTGGGAPPQRDLVAGLWWKQPSAEDAPEGRSWMPTLETYGQPGAGRGPWADNPVGWFYAGYGPFRRMAGGSSDAQRLMVTPGSAGRLVTLFHEEASLAESVTWLVEQHLKRLENRAGAAELLETVLALLSDGLLPDGFRVSHVDSDGLWVKRDGQRDDHYALREMSDGYRTVTSLVLDIVRQLHSVHGNVPVEQRDGPVAVTLPGVVLIDEIDAHLHISWQRRIGEWLKKHFPHIQFIVTTHSPYVCQAADEAGLIRLPGLDEQRPAEVVEGELYRRIVFGSGDDAALSELFGLDSPYSERAEKMRRRLGDLEEAVLDGEAAESEVTEYQELSERLTSSLSSRVAEVSARIGRSE